jgi:hypothetical protein
MDELIFYIIPIVVALVMVALDPANAIAGTGVGFAAAFGLFGHSWRLFLGSTVLVSALAQLIYFVRGTYEISFASVLTGYAICLVVALVFGAKVFKLTGNLPKA